MKGNVRIGYKGANTLWEAAFVASISKTLTAGTTDLLARLFVRKQRASADAVHNRFVATKRAGAKTNDRRVCNKDLRREMALVLNGLNITIISLMQKSQWGRARAQRPFWNAQKVAALAPQASWNTQRGKSHAPQAICLAQRAPALAPQALRNPQRPKAHAPQAFWLSQRHAALAIEAFGKAQRVAALAPQAFWLSQRVAATAHERIVTQTIVWGTRLAGFVTAKSAHRSIVPSWRGPRTVASASVGFQNHRLSNAPNAHCAQSSLFF